MVVGSYGIGIMNEVLLDESSTKLLQCFGSILLDHWGLF